MQMYVNKNGQQLGPFEEAKVLEMLRGGQFSPNDLGFKQGQTQWQKLGEIFPAQSTSGFSGFTPTQPVSSIQPPTSVKSGSSTGLKFGLIGCAGIILLGIVGAAGFFIITRNRSTANNLASNTSNNSSNTGNSNSSSNTNPTGKSPEYYKAYNDKTLELSQLKPPLKLDKNAKLKGKVTIISKTQYNFDFRMIGFETRSNPNLQQYVSNDKTAAQEYGLTFDNLAENLEELDSLVQIICEKGRVVGRYTGGITAYSNRCQVKLIDYKANAVVAQKTFENSTPEKEITTRKDQTEEVLLYPFAEITKYIKQFPRG